MKTDEAAWLTFKAMRDNPALPPCPFCGVRHQPETTHPYCTTASEFNLWRAHGQSR
jgi:hypothetical protein